MNGPIIPARKDQQQRTSRIHLLWKRLLRLCWNKNINGMKIFLCSPFIQFKVKFLLSISMKIQQERRFQKAVKFTWRQCWRILFATQRWFDLIKTLSVPETTLNSLGTEGAADCNGRTVRNLMAAKTKAEVLGYPKIPKTNSKKLIFREI